MHTHAHVFLIVNTCNLSRSLPLSLSVSRSASITLPIMNCAIVVNANASWLCRCPTDCTHCELTDSLTATHRSHCAFISGLSPSPPSLNPSPRATPFLLTFVSCIALRCVPFGFVVLSSSSPAAASSSSASSPASSSSSSCALFAPMTYAVCSVCRHYPPFFTHALDLQVPSSSSSLLLLLLHVHSVCTVPLLQPLFVALLVNDSSTFVVFVWQHFKCQIFLHLFTAIAAAGIFCTLHSHTRTHAHTQTKTPTYELTNEAHISSAFTSNLWHAAAVTQTN